ncbi:efflux RND transporter periplasmic adaptor subunit [Desulfosporosinus fructosivorans]
MKKPLWWGIGIVFVLSLAYGGWWLWGRDQGPMKVKAVVVAPITMQEEVYATGSLVPVSRQEVRVLNPGLVTKVAVKSGESVKAGQVLITLDSTLTDAQVAQAKANVEAAQTGVNSAQSNLNELKRVQSASEANLSPLSASPGLSSTKQAEGALAQSKATLKQAQEALKIAQVQQGQMVYKASIAGTVIEVNAQEGNLSPVQQPLVSVADLSQMNVESRLNELDAGKVRIGGKVTISSKLLGKTPAQGTVTEISPQAVATASVQGNSSATVGVKIHLDQVPAGLKPGFSVNIQMIVSTKEGVLAVPQEVLFQEGKKNFVYLIQAGKLVKTEVLIGIGTETHQEISSGLKAGDLIVLNPSNELSQGLAVTADTGSGET